MCKDSVFFHLLHTFVSIIFKQMKRVLFLFISTICITNILASEDDIIGVWEPIEKDGKTEIYKLESGEFQGKIVWLAEPYDSEGKPMTDKKNFSRSKRNVPLMGLVVLKEIYYDAEEGCYTVEYAYEPQMGMSGSGKIWVEGDKLTIKAGKLGITKTRKMERVK